MHFPGQRLQLGVLEFFLQVGFEGGNRADDGRQASVKLESESELARVGGRAYRNDFVTTDLLFKLAQPPVGVRQGIYLPGADFHAFRRDEVPVLEQPIPPTPAPGAGSPRWRS